MTRIRILFGRTLTHPNLRGENAAINPHHYPTWLGLHPHLRKFYQAAKQV
jgi:hypothetical protein